MIGIIILTVVALILGIILVVFDSKLDQPNKIDEIKKHLPGLNCGACGLVNCEGLAKAIDEDPSCYTKCRALRGENLEKFKQFLKENYDYHE